MQPIQGCAETLKEGVERLALSEIVFERLRIDEEVCIFCGIRIGNTAAHNTLSDPYPVDRTVNFRDACANYIIRRGATGVDRCVPERGGAATEAIVVCDCSQRKRILDQRIVICREKFNRLNTKLSTGTQYRERERLQRIRGDQYEGSVFQMILPGCFPGCQSARSPSAVCREWSSECVCGQIQALCS